METTPDTSQQYWQRLLDIENKDERDRLDRIELEAQCQDLTTQMETTLKMAYDSLYLRAKLACDFFVGEMLRRKDSSGRWPEGEAPGIRPYVRITPKGTIEAGWYRLRITVQPATAAEIKSLPAGFTKGKRVSFFRKENRVYKQSARYERIRKGSTKTRFPDSVVRKEPEWVQDAFAFVEDRLEPLRMEQKAVGIIRRYLKTIDRSQLAFFDAELAFAAPESRPIRESVLAEFNTNDISESDTD